MSHAPHQTIYWPPNGKQVWHQHSSSLQSPPLTPNALPASYSQAIVPASDQQQHVWTQATHLQQQPYVHNTPHQLVTRAIPSVATAASHQTSTTFTATTPTTNARTHQARIFAANGQEQCRLVHAVDYEGLKLLPPRPQEKSVARAAKVDYTHLLREAPPPQTQNVAQTARVDYTHLLRAAPPRQQVVARNAKVDYTHLLRAAPPPRTQASLSNGMALPSVTSASFEQNAMQMTQQQTARQPISAMPTPPKPTPQPKAVTKKGHKSLLEGLGGLFGIGKYQPMYSAARSAPVLPWTSESRRVCSFLASNLGDSCPWGYSWFPIEGGYRCGGARHVVSHALAEEMMRSPPRHPGYWESRMRAEAATMIGGRFRQSLPQLDPTQQFAMRYGR